MLPRVNDFHAEFLRGRILEHLPSTGGSSRAGWRSSRIIGFVILSSRARHQPFHGHVDGTGVERDRGAAKL